jgi:hypothetical protein
MEILPLLMIMVSAFVRLLVPAGEVILVVCHLALDHVAGHQLGVLRISFGTLCCTEIVLKFTPRGFYFGVV